MSHGEIAHVSSSGGCRPHTQRMMCMPVMHAPFADQGFPDADVASDDLAVAMDEPFFARIGGGDTDPGPNGPTNEPTGDFGDAPGDPGDPKPPSGDPHAPIGDGIGDAPPVGGGGGIVIH